MYKGAYAAEDLRETFAERGFEASNCNLLGRYSQ